MNRKYLLGALLAVSALMGGCMVGPKFRPPVVETPSKYLGTPGTAASDLLWWQLFDDSTLVRLVSTALANNRNVGMAFSRVEQARLALKATRAQFGPSLQYGVNAQYGTESYVGLTSDKPIQTYIIKPTISWEIDLFGKIRRMSEADQARLLASDQAAQGVLVALVADVASTYFEYLQYEYAVETARSTYRTRMDTYELLEHSFRAGSIGEMDLKQAQSAYATAAALIPQYERARQQSLHALSLLLGQNPSQVVGVHVPLDEFPVPGEVPAGLPSDLLARRSDMQQAYYQTMAANAEVGVAQAMRFPTIALTANGGVLSEDIKKLFDAKSYLWSAAGGISGPIFNFGANKRRMQVAREKYRESVLNYEQCYLQALHEVEDALTAVATYREQVGAMRILVQAAQRADTIAVQQYNAGQISFLNVLDSERTLLEARTNYAQALSGMLGSYATLYKALGGGITSPEETFAAAYSDSPTARAHDVSK